MKYRPRHAFSILLAIAAVCGTARAQEADALRQELRDYPHRILFERYVDKNWELFVMNADGSGVSDLTNTPAINELYPQASPDGTRICFLADVEQDGATLRSVYYMNADGSDRTLVAEKARQPCWNPDGTRIAYVKQEFSRFQVKDFASKGLFFYDLKTGASTQHPNEAIEHLYTLNWPAGGRWIVSTVHAGMGFGHGIIAIETEGPGFYDLGIPGCRPCLSNDGTKITWSPGDKVINVADIDLKLPVPKVSNVRTVASHETLHLYHPDFSPDGRYVVFSRGPGGRSAARGPGTHTEVAEMVGVCGDWDLFLTRSDGSGPQIQLTDAAKLSNKEPDWLPVGNIEGAAP